MVFQSLTLFARTRGPDEFWRKRKIFKLSAHYRGRRRNCYSIAIRNVHRALQFATKSKKLRREDIKELWITRVNAACQEHGLPSHKLLREGLTRSEIMLDYKTLTDLAVWEPRTFKSLVSIAWARCKQDGLNGIQNLDVPSGIITRGMIK